MRPARSSTFTCFDTPASDIAKGAATSVTRAGPRIKRSRIARRVGSAIARVHRILKEERDIVIESRPVEATRVQVENIRMAYVFYESGLSINVMYTVDSPKKRAVGFKLSDGMEVPAELASRFKFARQKSKLAGTIRGSYFNLKNEY